MSACRSPLTLVDALLPVYSQLHVASALPRTDAARPPLRLDGGQLPSLRWELIFFVAFRRGQNKRVDVNATLWKQVHM